MAGEETDRTPKGNPSQCSVSRERGSIFLERERRDHLAKRRRMFWLGFRFSSNVDVRSCSNQELRQWQNGRILPKRVMMSLLYFALPSVSQFGMECSFVCVREYFLVSTKWTKANVIDLFRMYVAIEAVLFTFELGCWDRQCIQITFGDTIFHGVQIISESILSRVRLNFKASFSSAEDSLSTRKLHSSFAQFPLGPLDTKRRSSSGPFPIRGLDRTVCFVK